MGFRIEDGILYKYKDTGEKDVIIPDGVTRIGDNAFFGCEFKRITIPDSVTSIGDGAFYSCEELTSVTLPRGITSIGQEAFCECYRLTSITIPDGVTSIGKKAFYKCFSLPSITIPDSVTSIGDKAFFFCRKLKNIALPDSVTSIGDEAFSGCDNLTSITIPNSVTSIGDRAFDDCSKLASVKIPTAFSKKLPEILPETESTIILHIENLDITTISENFRPGAAVGFAEDGGNCTDKNGMNCCKYIKENAVNLIELAMEHPALFNLMLREKLIAAKDLDAVAAAVQENGDAEMIAAIADYSNSIRSKPDAE